VSTNVDSEVWNNVKGQRQKKTQKKMIHEKKWVAESSCEGPGPEIGTEWDLRHEGPKQSRA
jgi:hypothetical protein